jgi:hypothetical protein
MSRNVQPVISPVEIMDRRIGDREISDSLVAARIKPSEVIVSRVDQAGKYVIVETSHTCLDRAQMAELCKCVRFAQLETTYSIDGTIWFFFKTSNSAR